MKGARFIRLALYDPCEPGQPFVDVVGRKFGDTISERRRMQRLIKHWIRLNDTRGFAGLILAAVPEEELQRQRDV